MVLGYTIGLTVKSIEVNGKMDISTGKVFGPPLHGINTKGSGLNRKPMEEENILGRMGITMMVNGRIT